MWYIILLLWRDIAYLCWKCRYLNPKQTNKQTISESNKLFLTSYLLWILSTSILYNLLSHKIASASHHRTENKLKFNTLKTKEIVFHRRRLSKKSLRLCFPTLNEQIVPEFLVSISLPHYPPPNTSIAWSPYVINCYFFSPNSNITGCQKRHRV